MASTTQISFRISNDLLSRLRSVAEREDRTVSNLLNRIVRQYLTSLDKTQHLERPEKAAQEARERVLAESTDEDLDIDEYRRPATTEVNRRSE